MIEIRYESAGISSGRAELTNFARAVVVRTLDNLGWKRAAVTVLFCSDEKIRDLNREFREIDEPTDILSFPSGDDQEAMKKSDAPYLGDLAIALPYTARHAGESGRALEEEIALLLVHGVLHLLGWDHENKMNERRMWKEQERLLELMKDVKRPEVKIGQ